jgi:exoribonuclease-2
LPPVPNSLALAAFLAKEKATNPVTFPDISLAIIKLLGSGEYVAESPVETSPGHFGLAVRDYTHSTAPNRRYPDLITQRLLKAAMQNEQAPYSKSELESLADHCTKAEDNANKVERQVTKSAAAMLLESRIGEQFDAIVTGSGPKGTWARLFNPPVEGKLSYVSEDIDVGHRIRVELTHVDVERGFIDFKRI